MLVSIFLCDLFYITSDSDFASYADDNTPYVLADTIYEIMKRLETASVKLFKWFEDNQMKANQFHSRSINNKINRLHERVLRIVYNGFKSSFENLLEKDGTVSMHVKNLQKLATEMFKISKKFFVSLMRELFHQQVNHYDLRNPYDFAIPNVNNVFHFVNNVFFFCTFNAPWSTHMVVSTI